MEKHQLVLCFIYFAKEHLLIGEDFNVEPVYRKLLMFDHIC